MATTLSVVIPTHNRREKLVRLIDGIQRSDFDQSALEIIVVADHCTDDTVEYLTEHHRDVQLITPTEHVYSQGGRALGGAAAVGEYVLFIDDDNVVDPGCCAALVRAMEAHPEIGLIGPLMYRWPETAELWCAGAVITRYATVDRRVRGPLPLDPAAPELTTPCDTIPNAFMIRRRLLAGPCPIDPLHFPGSWAEADLSLRVKLAGYEVRIAREAVVFHDLGYAGFAIRLRSADRIEQQARSRLWIRRRYPWAFRSPAWFWLVTFPLSSAYYLYRFARDGHLVEWSRAYARGTVQGLRDPLPDPPGAYVAARPAARPLPLD